MPYLLLYGIYRPEDNCQDNGVFLENFAQKCATQWHVSMNALYIYLPDARSDFGSLCFISRSSLAFAYAHKTKHIYTYFMFTTNMLNVERKRSPYKHIHMINKQTAHLFNHIGNMYGTVHSTVHFTPYIAHTQCDNRKYSNRKKPIKL